MSSLLRLQRLFAEDRSNPLFASQLTIPQLRIIVLLEINGGGTGRELAELTGVGLATMSGMIDRLAAQDLVARHEDPHDRRVRRITLTPAGHELVQRIMSAGVEQHRAILSRLSGEELDVVRRAVELMVTAAEAERGSGQV